MNTVSLLHWILFLPLGAAAFSAFFLRRQGAFAAWFSTVTAFVIAGLALNILTQTSEDIKWHYELGKIGEISLGFGYLIDAHARLMLFVVSFVAAWIHLFSVGYMKEDDSRGRFFAGLSIFMFSILGIVIADNLLMTFIFWELVGFSSYMLIAHYFDTDFAAQASKKAFITNRVGDLGFILGIALCLKLYGTLDFAELKLHAGAAVPIGLGLLLMCGFLGKSAQFPLHVWLTDAMAGPTPVSALIHAATMVAAGVYFMARISFLLAPEVLHWMAISGAGMAALAGLCALAQTDIKKSLAYSTLAHLGIMGCAIGLGHPELAVLHMAMHAFFKATLFLGAGSVIHGCHHEQDMLKMGGLLKKMPITAATFIAATLSNCAVPFFAGWYSKDAIIEAAWHGEHFIVFSFLALAAVATCLYSGRMIRLVFMGAPNSKAATDAHESPWTMTLPISVLGIVYAIGAGFAANVLIPHSSLQVVEKSLNEMTFHLTAPATIVGVVALILGYLSFKFYGLFVGQDSLQKISPRTYQVLEYRWMDTFYNWYIDKVQRRFAEFIVFLDLLVINGLAVRWIIGGTFAALGHVSSAIFHRGQTRAYAIWITLGSLLFIWFLLR